MRFFRRATGRPARLGVLAGSFNPVTVAHLALARAARSYVDEVVFVLPQVFPHKDYSGASFADRVHLLCELVQEDASFSVAETEGGLFIEIAEECRAAYGPDVQLTFLCGRDAAERIAGWDYGKPGALEEMLRQFDLLVAARRGQYEPPESIRKAVRCLTLDGEFDHVSATEVRTLVSRGGQWEHLVPPTVRERVRQIYCGNASTVEPG